MPTVLLVDDSPVVRHAAGSRFAAEGFAVHTEGDAGSARVLDLGAFDCVVLDLELGDSDGADLAASLLARRPHLPVAFFTAAADATVRQRARRTGPVFDKPDLDAIVAWAKNACQPPPTK